MPLPTPIGRQREVLYLPARGHHVVLGTAGSGKTTLAILRAAYLSDPTTDHQGKTLLITFTRSLVAYLRYLQDGRLDAVTVENYHKFARGYLASRGKMLDDCICRPKEMVELIKRAVIEVAARYDPHPFFESKLPLFVDEIKWIAQQGIRDVAAYQAAERVGRTTFRVTRGDLRRIVFEIRARYLELRAEIGKQYDWEDIATAVSDEFASDASTRSYKHVIIDEGQDFSPEVIRSLVAAVPADGSVTFFGDVAQQIYGHRVSWRSAGLCIAGTYEFRENYRNTRQIALLGLAVSRMPYFRDTPDIVEPVSPTADGPLPALVTCPTEAGEIQFVMDQAIAAARTLSVAVLVRKRAYEALLAPRLPHGSIRLHRDMTTWTAGPGLKYGTYHAAKGMEFDAVFLPFCSRERLPDPEEVDSFGPDDAAIEDGRLLYVGVTRAKSRLIISYTGDQSALLPPDDTLYDRSTL